MNGSSGPRHEQPVKVATDDIVRQLGHEARALRIADEVKISLLQRLVRSTPPIDFGELGRAANCGLPIQFAIRNPQFPHKAIYEVG